jgi:hypothetical protein
MAHGARNSDPLAGWLRDTLGLRPVQFGLIMLGLNIAIDAAMAWTNGCLFTPPGAPHPGLLQDPTALLFDLVIIPTIAGLYLWSGPGVQRLWSALDGSAAFADQAVLRSEYRRSWRRYSSQLFFWLALTASLVLTAAQVAAHMGWVPWSTISGWLFNNPLMSLGRAAFWFLLFYMTCFGAWNMLVSFAALDRLFRQVNLKYQPLHPDQCSGLAWVGRFILTTAIAIVPLGLVISVSVITELRQGTLSAAPPVAVMLAVYLGLAPVFFVWPAWAAHRGLVRARYERLSALAQQHEQIAAHVHQTQSDWTNPALATAANERLNLIKQLYDTTARGPVWPFDLQALRSFGAAYLGVLLPAVVTLLIERFGKALLGP